MMVLSVLAQIDRMIGALEHGFDLTTDYWGLSQER